MTRPYTRSAPVSLHIGKQARIDVNKTRFSGSYLIGVTDENGNHAGTVFFENEAAMHLFAEALRGKVEA